MNVHSNMIDAEARGKLRVLRTQLVENYAAIARFTAAMQPETITNFMLKKGKGRRRIFARINNTLCRRGARLVVANLEGKRPVAMWALLEPRESVLHGYAHHPRDNQDCVCVNYWMLGWSPGDPLGSMQEGVWSLEITTHALGRCLQRSRDADPVDVIFEIHEALLRVGNQPLQQLHFDLRVGEHVLACEVRGARSPTVGMHLHTLIRTYLEFDQIHPQREADLIVPNGAHAEWLFPHPFKHIELQDDGAFAIAVEPLPFTNNVGRVTALT